MGKYDKFYGSTKDVDISIKVDIANELALLVEEQKMNNRQLKEANRLKRWELKQKYPPYTHERMMTMEGARTEKITNYPEEELEDKA